MSRIELNIVATGNFRNVETSVSRLRSQIDSLNASMMAVGFNTGISKSVSLFQDQFNSAIDSSGMFERHMVNLTTETNRFGRSLESGSMRLGQLFRAATEYRRGELGQIRQLAREQVRLSNATTMRMADGTAQVIVPRGIDEGIEKQRILNQEYRIFRQVVSNGSTEIINWGKNTQWAGRQLTVGLTVPLTIFGAAAGKMFMDADKQLTRLTKVYGDATKGAVNADELAKIRSETLALSQEIAGSMGVAVEETLGIAADIAATGAQGNDLLAATSEAMRLSVLGEVDRQEAMKATLSIQSVFKKDTEGLTQSINLLNAVENQTSATINDLVTGIVKAGPVVQGLGGDVSDLAAMMVAMREGGVSASEAANAIKSSLASLINPTKQTTEVLSGFGIDIKSIVDKNAGDVIGTLMDLQSALSGLDDLSRQRAIEQVFGKFQFSRINALLANLGKAGSQTEQVFAIAGMSVEELAKNADAELKSVTESVTGRFQRAFESLKASLIPIGETFVTVGTILLNVGNKVLEIFNSIPEPIKNIIKGLLGVTAVIGPIIMITGVLGNFFGYLVKGISTLLAFKKEGRGAFDLLTVDSIAARDATELLSESLYDQSTAMNTMSSAVDTLVKKLQELVNQLNHAKGASSGLDQAAQGVMANAEAAAIVRMGPATPYTTPAIPWKKDPDRYRFTGAAEIDAQYSHLTSESHLVNRFENSGRGLLGVGTFVDKSAAAVQADLKENLIADLTAFSEETVTPEQRRQELIRLARLEHPMQSGKAYEESIAKIMALSDEQLAQIIPTWEKLTAQSAEYFAILSAAADVSAKHTDEVKAAFEQFSSDITDPSVSTDQALTRLRQSIINVDGAVDSKVDDIKQKFDEIKRDVSSIQDPKARAEETARRITDDIVGPYEKDAIKVLSAANIPGVGQDGLRKPLLQAIQMYTDEIFNNVKSSKELVQAANDVNQAMAEYEQALSRSEAALAKSDAAAKELEEAEKSLAAKLRSGPKKYQDLDPSTARKQDDKWFIGDTEIKNQELIVALERRATALEELSSVEIELAESSMQTATAQEKLSQKTVELARVRENEIELALAESTGNQELINATRELIEARNREAQAAAERLTAEDQYQIAVKREADARAEYAKAQKESAQALLRHGPNSPQFKAAQQKEYQVKQELIEAEVGLATASEKKKVAVLNSTKATNELSEEEIQLAALREKQSLEVVENTVVTQQNTTSTQKGTLVKEGQTGAVVGNTGATDKDSKGLLRGGRLGGILSLASMAALFLPRPSEDTGAGQALNAGLNIANMAGMGSFFGGPGIAIGAGVGAAIEGYNLLQRKSEETAAELEKLRSALKASVTGLTDMERGFFDIEPLKQLEDIPLSAFNLKTQEATTKLKEFALALKEAEPGSAEAGRVEAIKGMEDANQFINNPMFQRMVAEALLGGMSIEDIKIMMGGYLDAAGKQMFAPIVNAELTRIGTLGKNPKEIGAKYLGQLQEIADRVIEGAGYTDAEGRRLRRAQQRYETARDGQEIVVRNPETGEEQQANLADTTKYLNGLAKEFGVTLEDLIAYILDPSKMPREGLSDTYQQGLIDASGAAAMGIQIGGESALKQEGAYREIVLSAQELVAISPDLYEISDVMGAIGNEAELMANAIFSALASGGQTFDQWIQSLGTSADEMENNKALISEISSKLGAMSPEAQEAFDSMIANGTSLQDTLRIVSMLIGGVEDNWINLSGLARLNPAEFEIRWNQFISGPGPGITPASGATMPESAIESALGAIDYSGGGGGGSGGSGSDYYDKLIEAQDKIIEGIQKEREERQKLLELQEKQVDFALRRQDLENQIARATAEGNFAEAALLQAQLDAEKEKYQAEEIERRRQEREDKKIAAAEKEKERLQKLQDASSGGGGGGGSTGPSAAQQQWTANRVEVLTSGVVNWTEGAELRTRTAQSGPWSAFFNSDRVKKYRQELEKLNIPAENINQILLEIYESWIDNNKAFFEQTDDWKFISDSLKDVKLNADQVKDVMPEVFGAMVDEELNPNEKIDLIAEALYNLGFESDQARTKAEKLYSQWSTDFPGKGIRKEAKEWEKQNSKDYVPPTEPSTHPVANNYLQNSTHPVARGYLKNPRPSHPIANGYLQGDGRMDIGGGDFPTPDMTPVGRQMGDQTMAGWEDFMTSPLAAARSIAAVSQGMIYPIRDGLADTIGSIFDLEFTNITTSFSDIFTDAASGINAITTNEVTTAANNFYTSMTTRMQDTVDAINDILTANLNDYTFQITGDPKIYDGGARSIWQQVFQGLPDSIFTPEMPKYASGGYVSGPGGPTEDKIPALLSDGEYVIKASSVSQYGTELLDQINARKFYTGGYVSADRAEYNASRRPTYFGGTPTSSTGYNAPAPSYYGGTPTYTGGYTSTSKNTRKNTGPANELNIAYTGSGLISYGGGNYAWDTIKGKYVKIADTKTGAAASGFGLIAQGVGQSIDQNGFWGTLSAMASHIKENPEELIPFVGSSRIDTSNQEGKDIFAATSLLDILSVIPGMTGVAALGRAGISLGRLGVTGAKSVARSSRPALSSAELKQALESIPDNIGITTASAARTGTRNSRSIVSKDYTDLLSMSRKDLFDYIDIAFPQGTLSQKIAFINGITSGGEKVDFFKAFGSPGQVTASGTNLELLGPTALRESQVGYGNMDVLNEIALAKRWSAVFDELSASGNPVVANQTLPEFINKLKESSIPANITGSTAENVSSIVDKDFVSLVNEVYARQNYGLSPDDLIRFYRGDRPAASNLMGYSSIDPQVAALFALQKSGKLVSSDIKISDLPQPFGLTGWSDEFAQFIPKGVSPELLPHGINSKYIHTKNYRFFSAENAFYSNKIEFDKFKQHEEQIIEFAKNNGIRPRGILPRVGFVRSGNGWQFNLRDLQSRTPDQANLLKYMQDELGIDILSLKTETGLKPYRFTTGTVGLNDDVVTRINPEVTGGISPSTTSSTSRLNRRTGLGLAATAPLLGGWFGDLSGMLSMATSPGGLAALGMGAAALSPFGRRVLTMPYHAVRNRDILKHAIHVSNNDRGTGFKGFLHPRDVPTAHARANGPGTYFADDRQTSASDMFRRNEAVDPMYAAMYPQDTWLRPIPLRAKAGLMTGWNRWGKAGDTTLTGNNKLLNQPWDSKIVQRMRRRGIVGVHSPGYTSIFDFGVPGQWGYREIPRPPRNYSLKRGITPYARAATSIISKAGSIGVPPAALWYLLNNMGMFAEGGLVRVGKENLTVLGNGISDYARKFTGTPYSSSAAWADGPANGWGCATATKWLYDSYAGVDLGHPSLSASQYSSSAGSQVSNMLPGDLLYFYYKNGVNTSNPINHTGMYLGDGSMFHARSEALGTQITGVDEAGMDRARTRAGGTAIKRYLPLTIAGMGIPTAQFKMGGKVYGKGGPTSDDILALISNGEYVMNASAVSHYGKDFMDAVNKGILPEAAMGGMFSSKYPGYVQKMGDGGMLSRKFGKDSDSSPISNVEYNINVNVAGTNSSPDDIAEAVMKSLKRKERMVGAVTRV